MRQYLDTKAQFPDAIVFFRMGDFYEMFFEDAKIASKLLDLTLTKRQNEIPMAGIPYHASTAYIQKLLQFGKKIVICEQIASNDPKQKLMNREVTRVVTPGTVIEENFLDGYSNNFLGILLVNGETVELGFADVSTKEFYKSSFSKKEIYKIQSELFKFAPKELIHLAEDEKELQAMELDPKLLLTPIALDGATSKKLELILENYLKYNYRSSYSSIANPTELNSNEFLSLDETTVRNLDLVENPKDPGRTLFGVLNQCETASGKRLLKKRILFPFSNAKQIREQWKKFEHLEKISQMGKEIAEILSGLSDLERILARVQMGKAFPRDIGAIKKTIESYKVLISKLKNSNYLLKPIPSSVLELEQQILKKLTDSEIPNVLGEGFFLRKGFSEEYDKAVLAKDKGKDWIEELEESERKKTGLGTLKIRYNKILGYYVEISRNQAKDAPKEYTKKQTLVNLERFTFTKLEKLEVEILNSLDTILEIEERVFLELVESILKHQAQLLVLQNELTVLDLDFSFFTVIKRYGWVKPEISESRNLVFWNGRHPTVESALKVGEHFVPNSLEMNETIGFTAILTGPNMAGKSTYMRQVALIQILFQMGLYVPAQSATLPVLDGIYTRMGSSDNLTMGESTFFVEMKETARILDAVRENSMVLLDEVGRGTSTYDGMSLAWAILEYVSNLKHPPFTLFATHYHELTELEKRGNGIFNLYMDTVEKNGEILFLKKVKKGIGNKSFGIYVAKIAGIPNAIIKRSQDLLKDLEKNKKEFRPKTEPEQLSLFVNIPSAIPEHLLELEKKLESIDLNHTTPMKALEILQELKEQNLRK